MPTGRTTVVVQMDVMRRVRSHERVTLLRDVWLFEGCSTKELRSIARITSPLSVQAGRTLAREGERGREFAVIVEGEATVTIGGETIGAIGPGSFYGELSLLDRGRRTATVTARTAMLLLVLDRYEFDALVDRSIPSVSRKMLMVLADRLRRADERTAGTQQLA
jgi:CRP-like cAMP-binding protein